MPGWTAILAPHSEPSFAPLPFSTYQWCCHSPLSCASSRPCVNTVWPNAMLAPLSPVGYGGTWGTKPRRRQTGARRRCVEWVDFANRSNTKTWWRVLKHERVSGFGKAASPGLDRGHAHASVPAVDHDGVDGAQGAAVVLNAVPEGHQAIARWATRYGKWEAGQKQ